MFNSLAHQFNTLNVARAYAEKHDDPVGVVKILLDLEDQPRLDDLGYEAEPHEEDRLPEDGCTGCGEDHDPWDCTAGMPDWDAMAKDEELMD